VQLAVGLVLALTLLSGCSGLYGGIQKTLRRPGERLRAFPEEVWQEYGCEKRKLPFLRIEKNEIVPRRLRAGSDFNHRLVYVLCPAVPTQVVAGSLNTGILFRGRPLVQEVDRSFEIKPGRWVVDTFIEVPQQAEIGIYALQIEFKARQLGFKKKLTFAVDRSEAQASKPARERTVQRD
jgi:hypothetical protein